MTQWLNTIQTDIADGELSKGEMGMGFPKAHGGVRDVNVEKYLTLIPGKQFMLTPQPDGLAEGTNWQIKLYNAPEWVSVENNIIKIAPSAAQTAGNLSFDVELIANGVAKGRKVTLKLEVLAMTTLLQGQLGATGGKIENQWKDIALEAPAGALKQTYDFTYIAGLNSRGEFYSTFNTTPTLSSEEAASLNLIEPQSEEIITNYLTSTSSSMRTNISAKARIESNMTPSTSYDGNVAGGCANEPEWGDYSVSTDILKGDGFIFNHILQGTQDWFDVALKRRIPKKIAQNLKNSPFSVAELCASRLWGTRILADVAGKEPVLFVHGFIRSGKLGGFDEEEYFGSFPALVAQMDGGKYEPFMFEWRTDARFEEVATELGKAIALISEKTGKKVHIVAHSFGGVLARVLIQGKADEYVGQQIINPWRSKPNFVLSARYNRAFANNNIASLTTVGSPHSGVFGGAGGKVGATDFPNGQDGLPGWGIDFCTAQTCHQMGASVNLFRFYQNRGLTIPVYDNESLGVDVQGQLVASLANSSYSDSIPTQVLIGIGGITKDYGAGGITIGNSNMEISCAKSNTPNKCDIYYANKPNDLNKQGDGLISFFGQRFEPNLTSSSLLRRGNVEEHILGFDSYLDVSGMTSAFDENFLTNQSWQGRSTDYDSSILPVHAVVDPSSKNQWLTDVGIYNHRTGQYRHKLFAPSVAKLGNPNIPISVRQFSEVGLQNCFTPASNGSSGGTFDQNCPHATWKYFKNFVKLHPADNIAPPTKIPVTLQQKYPTTPTARAVGGAVPAGSWVRIHANGRMLAQVDIAADGSVNVPVEFVANTNYTLRIHSPGYRAKFINGEDFGATTGATVAESSLNFGVIEMETLPFAAGDMKVVVTNAVTGRSVTGYKVTAYNSVNNITGKKEEADTVANPTPTLTTLPKGYHRLEVSKNGYEIAKQMCYAKENQLTTCQINIVPKNSVSAGQLLSVLRWDVNPEDLDTHLFKYDASGKLVYQIYYESQVSGTDSLDVDDRYSYGPETVTINQLDPRANYVYAVHHYIGSGSITTTSQAQVSVLQNGKPVRIYKAPLTGEGRWWKVFEVQNGQVIPCQSNCMYSTTPQPTLRSRGVGQPRWLQDAMQAPMPKK